MLLGNLSSSSCFSVILLVIPDNLGGSNRLGKSLIILYIGVFLKYGFSNLLKYIDGRDCAQQEKLVGGLVEMIQWGQEHINIRNLENMVSQRSRVSQELYNKLPPPHEQGLVLNSRYPVISSACINNTWG